MGSCHGFLRITSARRTATGCKAVGEDWLGHAAPPIAWAIRARLAHDRAGTCPPVLLSISTAVTKLGSRVPSKSWYRNGREIPKASAISRMFLGFWLSTYLVRLSIPLMLHIATITSTPMIKECRYKQRAGFVAGFYTCDMALRIRELRESRGWTQDELAEKAGLSRSQLAQIESEARPANTLRLNAIAAALGVEPYALFSMQEMHNRILDSMSWISKVDQATIVRMAEALASGRPQD